MSDLLPYSRDDAGRVTVTLRQAGRSVVVLDSDLLRALDATLDAIGDDLAGFVLASEGRVFVAGANLKEIMALDDADLAEYLAFGSRVFGRIATLPCTSVAALNGAALGGGLEIALHCDLLVAARPPAGDGQKPTRPYQIGLPEAGLSICPGWGGTNLLPARLDPERAIRATATGQPLTVLEAAEAGLVAGLVDPDDLLAVALDHALAPKATPRTTPRCIADADVAPSVREALDAVRGQLPDTQAASAVAACVERGLDAGWTDALALEQSELIRLRGTDEGRSAINAFFERSAART